MIETTNRYGIYEVDYTKFGGIIYPSDYNTHYANSYVATRIESDKKFDVQCRRNILNRENARRNN